MTIDNLLQQRFSLAEKQFKRILDETPLEMAEFVHEYVAENKARFADIFYAQMLSDPQAVTFLENDLVNQRLKFSLASWFCQLFSVYRTEDLAGLIQHQFEVGEVHARINVPMYLVTQGVRVLQTQILKELAELTAKCTCSPLIVASYINQALSLSIELMSLAFEGDHEQKTRDDEAYRLLTFGQNLAAEKEKQKAALADWAQGIAFNLHSTKLQDDDYLARSEFGLWLVHKAKSIFGTTNEYQSMNQAVKGIDQQILPKIVTAESQGDKACYLENLAVLRSQIRDISYLLSSLFDRVLEIENGRDALTNLMNRRFMPSVLTQEIDLSRRLGQNFCLLFLDIDHFKKVNDRYGHEAGDLVLQHIAGQIMHSVRSGDFVFRYGGEEIVIILVEVTEQQSQNFAEKLRKKIAEHNVPLSSGDRISVTVSIGVAEHDGHPDYELLLRRADQALYQAKANGRNQTMVAV